MLGLKVGAPKKPPCRHDRLIHPAGLAVAPSRPIAGTAAESSLIGQHDPRLWRVIIANGLIEGINSLVQPAKAKARSYSSIRNLAAIIYLIAGKLDFACPLEIAESQQKVIAHMINGMLDLLPPHEIAGGTRIPALEIPAPT
jgi:hypothetical protein